MKLIGSCNQCGVCCKVGPLHCEHLETTGEIGTPMATRCKVFPMRYHMMPIAMLNDMGMTEMMAVCAGHGSELEASIIARRCIGNGCSLMVDPNA
jgi:hypothetical protein